jgi:hypothetical protein
MAICIVGLRSITLHLGPRSWLATGAIKFALNDRSREGHRAAPGPEADIKLCRLAFRKRAFQ